MYDQIKPGQVVYPAMEGYKLACECGCTHKIFFEIVRIKGEDVPTDQDEVLKEPDLRVRFTSQPDRRATAQLKRQNRQGQK